MLNAGDREYLARQLDSARIILFTGAGFSADACDPSGRGLPRGVQQVAEELWQMCFPGEPYDTSSTAQDLFDIALSRHRGQLAEYLANRFVVNGNSLPDHYCVWFGGPWARVYTLNVDDIEMAASRRCDLPRRPRSLSALASEPHSQERSTHPTMDVLHLNGRASEGPDAVTFGTAQHGRRIGGADVAYPLLVGDLAGWAFIFVGTTLDEPALWQHIELRGSRGARELRELRPRSFLVCPSLSRAREALLREYNVHWIKATAKEFADAVLRPLDSQMQTGVRRLLEAAGQGAEREGIPIVSQLIAPAGEPSPEKSLYLLGDEPRWSDIIHGVAIQRESDKEILDAANSALKAEGPGTLLLLSGTAGSGKSTALRRLAIRLAAEGHSVGWIDDSIDASPRRLRRFPDESDSQVLFIDNAGRYGAELAPIATSLLAERRLALLVLGMRSAHVERRLGGPRLVGIPKKEIPIPGLTDSDIVGLLSILDRNNLLGRLKGLPREEQLQAFREKADRQLLVAMIEATSGRRFEEKVFTEWQELTAHEKQAYGLVALSYSLGHSIDRERILIASGDAGNDVLNALEGLLRRHILREDGRSLRARHRLISEVLVHELLQQHSEFVLQTFARLAYAVAARVRLSEHRSARSWRILKSLLNHELLYRYFGYGGACRVYDEVADVLGWDYHYYLQRGMLELGYGDIRLAESYLGSARSLQATDPRVETAYAHMLLKKAASAPENPKAGDVANQAIDMLLDQIEQRGDRDSYPFHVLGSQGLSWLRRGRLSDSERDRLLKLLLKNVQSGVKQHPAQQDLRQLLTDLKREDLSRVVRR